MSSDTEVFPSAEEQCAASRAPIHCKNSTFPDGRVTCCESVRSCAELAAALDDGAITCGGSRFCFSQWSVASGYCVQERDGYVAEVYPVATSGSPSSVTNSVATATVTTTLTASTNSTTASSAVSPPVADAATESVALKPSSVSGSSNPAVQIAVPVALVALLLLGGGVFLFWWRRRRPQQQQPGAHWPPSDGNEKAHAQGVQELHEQFTAELAVHAPPVELPGEYAWSAGKVVDVEVSAPPRMPQRRSFESLTQPGSSGDGAPPAGMVTPQRRSLDGPVSPVSPMSPISSMGDAYTAPSTPVRRSLEGPTRPS